MSKSLVEHYFVITSVIVSSFVRGYYNITITFQTSLFVAKARFRSASSKVDLEEVHNLSNHILYTGKVDFNF